MSHFTEASLEQAIMQLFQEEGYGFTPGESIHRNVNDVVLRDDLRAFLRQRYVAVGITEMECENAIARLTASATLSLYENNRHTLRLITEGFALKRDDTTLPDLFVEPIDFGNADNNIFRIVNQFEVKGNETRIPDAVIFVNGLPLVVLEFKSAVKEEATIENAFTQLTVRYRRDIPELFKYNAFTVISDGVNNKYGSLFTPYEFFYAWRKIDDGQQEAEGINSLYTLIHGLFRKERLLAVVKDFIFMPDNSKSEKKIVCRYPQYFAATKLYDNILKHAKMNPDGDGKGGTYFGATGCGKSYIMLFLTRLLMRSRAFGSPTIVLITDRKDLDDQLAKDYFLNAKQFIGDDCIRCVSSRDDLRQSLKERQSGGVLLTTIQKFTEDARLLSRRNNIICISDEAHRSQVNLSQHIRVTGKGVARSFGFAKYLHDSLPNATFVGFTGTPIDATIDVFGPVVDAYTMTESVADGITKRIVYEGRSAKVLLDNAKLQDIERYYKQCEEEGATEYQIEESKKAVTQMEKILGDPDRLQAVAEDFIAHYERRIDEGSTVKGKAMFVCSNRHIAYELFKKIIALRPEWNIKLPKIAKLDDNESKDLWIAAEAQASLQEKIVPIERIKMVMTRNKDDAPELYGLLGDEDYRKKLDLQFKNPESNFKIAIVVDMWITGFDVPCLDTMYIDKPLQRHTLIQTISRVNRVYEGKEKGLVVDYIGIKSNMNAALKQYANAENDGFTIEMAEQSVSIVKDELDIIRRIFNKFDYSKFTNGTPLEQLECLNQGAEYIQRTQEREKLFMGHCAKLKSAFSLCCNSEAFTNEERESYYYFCGIRSIIFKLTKGEAPDATMMNRRVSEMVTEAIISQGVEEIIQVGNEGTTLDLMGDEYMKRLEKLKLPNTKIKLMEKLLRKAITDFKKVNKMKGVDFSQRLNELVSRYNERRDSVIFADEVLTEVANQMADLLKDLNEEKQSFRALGISYEEKAFYDILKAIAVQYQFIEQYPEEKLLALSKDVKTLIDDKSKYTDWSNRDDIKAELKMDLILILAEHGYPPVTNDEVFKEIFEQAENFKKYNGQ